MAVLTRGRRVIALTGVVGLALITAGGCSSKKTSTADKNSAECAAYKAYQGHDNTTVSIYATIRDAEADLLEQAWKQFADCTGIKIDYEGTGEFEAQIQVRVDGGNAAGHRHRSPSRACWSGSPRPASSRRPPAKAKTLAEENFSKDWLEATRRSTASSTAPRAAPTSSPSSGTRRRLFKDKGWKVPKTWDEMITLSDTIAAGGIKPWCAGIESGDATGWPATDWIEDVLLRDQGPEVYDQWVDHTDPVQRPEDRRRPSTGSARS